MRCGVVIPTLNGGELFSDVLLALDSQFPGPYRRLVIDSESTDGTVPIALAASCELIQIRRSEFSHGGTRLQGAVHLSDCEVVVFLTQDAVLADVASIAHLVESFNDPVVAVAFGRQLPHEGASPLAAHARWFNYGGKSLRKNFDSINAMGCRTFFCSNSFAAYRRSTLLQLGGFRHDLILGEDAEFCARAVVAGYTVVYCAEATVRHSHNYTVLEEFRRYFDTGVFHAKNTWLLDRFGALSGEGGRYVRSELEYLLVHAPELIPKSLYQNAAKLLAYRLGRCERWLPRVVKRVLSMSARYW